MGPKHCVEELSERYFKQYHQIATRACRGPAESFDPLKHILYLDFSKLPVTIKVKDQSNDGLLALELTKEMVEAERHAPELRARSLGTCISTFRKGDSPELTHDMYVIQDGYLETLQYRVPMQIGPDSKASDSES